MRLALTIATVTVLTGCSDIFGCTVDTKTIEVDYRQTYIYDLALQRVENLKKLGYDCQSISIRNLFGTAVGSTYTCTKCD